MLISFLKVLFCIKKSITRLQKYSFSICQKKILLTSCKKHQTINLTVAIQTFNFSYDVTKTVMFRLTAVMLNLHG